MYLYSLILENKELLKIFYALVISFICLVIVFKSDRLFRISLYHGIRYFRNAFLFYAFGFVIRYLLGAASLFIVIPVVYHNLGNAVFEYFLVMAGFFLLYSLIWKSIETEEAPFSSLLNTRISVFYLISLVIVALDYLWSTFYFMFISQIILFACMSIISYGNYMSNGKKQGFLKFYFIAMFLSFIAWTLNFLAAIYLDWNQIALMSIYILNLIVFLLFLFGVVNITKKLK